jgi:transposase InsO family protein
MEEHMAWKEIKVETQRKCFIKAYEEDKFKMADLCRQFGISRPTGYKWVERYELEGDSGLKNRSSAPHCQPGAIDPFIEKQILEIKYAWPKWGPKKVLGHLVSIQPTIHWPSATTIGNLFDRNGLTIPRKYRQRYAEKTDPLSHANKSNEVWSMDFKGWFLTKDNHKCAPFTITDNFSRFLLRCVKLNFNDGNHVWAILETAFREYGLPYFLRSDNGPPFATKGAGRLSALSIKLIKAGVIPEWIDPGNPQQNGRHERMHGTLAQEGIFPELNLEEQLMKFTVFQDYYNFTRPHETLGQVPPGSIYKPSPRIWNGKLKSPEYSEEYKIGRVKSCGKMYCKGHEIYIGRILEGEPLGLKETEEGLFTVHYGPIMLGTLTKDYELDIPRRPGRERRKGKTRI